MKPGKPLAKELSRIVAGELEQALDETSRDGEADQADAVHEARKHLKKLRAILRLLQKDLGREYRAQNGRLRAIAHQLSSLRDAEATVEIMSAVRKHYPALVTPSIFATVERGLMARERGTVTRLHPDRLLGRVTRELRRSAAVVPRQVRRAVGRSALQAGLERGYRRARKALAGVRLAPEDTGFHAWRRRVKDHWYQVRLFEGLNPQARDRARRLNRLETWLGDDHNLVLLRAAILNAPARFGDERATAIVLGCMAKYQATLRRRALKAGGRLFANQPRAFRKSVDRWCRPGRKSLS